MTVERADVAILGGGPAGLAAAEAVLAAGRSPVVFEGRPSVARKFLMAGKSGLNLTKDEPVEAVQAAISCPQLDDILTEFGSAEVMDWARGLGEPLFTGSSGRVFPKAMKASPLLRRWLARLGEAEIRTRHLWQGWDADGALVFMHEEGELRIRPAATVLALGGASWPRLGSDAAWVPWLAARRVPVRPFRPANMGFDCGWSAHFAERFAGHAVKGAALSVGSLRRRGEFVVTRGGIEGSLVYALSAPLRDALEAGGATLSLDLAPDRTAAALEARLTSANPRDSLSNRLRKAVRLTGVKAALLRECAPDALVTPAETAMAMKALRVPVLGPRPIAEAISSAGGIAWEGVGPDLSLHALPGVFAAGEMLDWEAPTGGYLLTACLATGFRAGREAAAAARRAR